MAGDKRPTGKVSKKARKKPNRLPLIVFSCGYLRLSSTGVKEFRRAICVAHNQEAALKQCLAEFPMTIAEHWNFMELSMDTPGILPIDS